MNREGPKGKYKAPAVEKAFEILSLLADQPEGMTISEMATKLNRTFGELFRIVIVMERHRYIQKSSLNDRYSVAYKLLDVALRGTPAQNLLHAALPEMQVLTREIEQSCHLVVANEGRGLIMAREENPATRGFGLKLGASIDLVNSCSGHVILAFSTKEKADKLIVEALVGREAGFDHENLQNRLNLVRERGYDMRSSPVAFGVTDICYPLFGFDGGLLAALTIPFLELIDGSQLVGREAARSRLAEASRRISAILGFQGAVGAPGKANT